MTLKNRATKTMTIKSSLRLTITWVLLGVGVHTACAQKGPRPSLVFETSNYTQTTTYAEVMQVVTYTASRMKNAYVDTMGYSVDGKVIPLVVLSDRKIRTSEQAKALKRPVIMVLANIHSGEVEGKDALLRLMLEFTEGKHKEILKKITLLLVPIYNADGNDQFDRLNRISQNGPEKVGVRPNKQGYDLNRDYIKLDSPEAQALIGRGFSYWDPLLFMDLHTTNGSYHGFHLTYSTPLNPNTHSIITEFQSNVMMPEIKKAMQQKQWRIFEYGNYINNVPDSGWVTFSEQPRYGTNYYGLRNRLTLLSEAYSYLDYKNRIAVTYDFVLSTLQYAASQHTLLYQMHQALDRTYADTTSLGQDSLGTVFRLAPPVIEDFYTGSVDTVVHADVNRMTFKMRKEVQARKIRNYGRFSATRFERIPAEYYIDNRSQQFDTLLIKLKAHGIAVEKVTTSLNAIEHFRVETKQRAARPFQGRHLLTFTGAWVPATAAYGTFYKVSTRNAHRNLIAYLLEPTTNDGLFAWGMVPNAPDQGHIEGLYRSRR